MSCFRLRPGRGTRRDDVASDILPEMASRRGGGAVTALALATLAFLPSSANADLPTFGYGNARLGTGLAGAGIAPTNVRRLSTAWRASIGGAVNDQALIADGACRRRKRDVVFVATDHGNVVALDASSGKRLWRQRVNTRSITPDCAATPDGRFGVTATMVLNRRAGVLYVVDVDGLAWAIRNDHRTSPSWMAGSGTSTRRRVCVGGLALSRGRLYVAIASLCDTGHSFGGVTVIDAGHPGRIVRWQTTAGTHAYGGGLGMGRRLDRSGNRRRVRRNRQLARHDPGGRRRRGERGSAEPWFTASDSQRSACRAIPEQRPRFRNHAAPHQCTRVPSATRRDQQGWAAVRL